MTRLGHKPFLHSVTGVKAEITRTGTDRKKKKRFLFNSYPYINILHCHSSVFLLWSGIHMAALKMQNRHNAILVRGIKMEEILGK
jgi:hypothetical protein